MIRTRYLGPTNYRGTRIVASTFDGQRLTHHRNFAVDPSQDHYEAAQKLALKLGFSLSHLRGQPWGPDTFYWITTPQE